MGTDVIIIQAWWGPLFNGAFQFCPSNNNPLFIKPLFWPLPIQNQWRLLKFNDFVCVCVYARVCVCACARAGGGYWLIQIRNIAFFEKAFMLPVY